MRSPKLPSNSEVLLNKLVESDNPTEYLSSQYLNSSEKKKDELRGIISELKSTGYIANIVSDGIREALETEKEEVKTEITEYYCPNCNADLTKQVGFDPDEHAWVCKGCGTQLFDDTISGDIIWYCDSCGSILNIQEGFTDSLGMWKCTQCGFENSITEDVIKG